MPLTRLSLSMLVAALSVVGALVGVGAQDRPLQTPSTTPGENPPTVIVVPDTSEPPTAPMRFPAKLPAELPSLPDKAEVRAPHMPASNAVLPSRGLPTTAPPGLPEAPSVVDLNKAPVVTPPGLFTPPGGAPLAPSELLKPPSTPAPVDPLPQLPKLQPGATPAIPPADLPRVSEDAVPKVALPDLPKVQASPAPVNPPPDWLKTPPDDVSMPPRPDVPKIQASPAPLNPAPDLPKIQTSPAPPDLPKVQTSSAPLNPPPDLPKVQTSPAPLNPPPDLPKVQTSPAPPDLPKIQTSPAPVSPPPDVPRVQAGPAPVSPPPDVPRVQAGTAPANPPPELPKVQTNPVPVIQPRLPTKEQPPAFPNGVPPQEAPTIESPKVITGTPPTDQVKISPPRVTSSVLAPGPSAPSEVKAPTAPSRPAAFLLVKPRRVGGPNSEPLPSATSPLPPTLIDPPSVVKPPLVADAPRVIDTPRVGEVTMPSSAAQVTVEKRGPTTLRAGVATHFQIVVRNRGALASAPVTVVDEIPRGARIVGGDPPASQLDDKALWSLPSLPAGAEVQLKLELQATSPGEFVGNTTVFVSTATVITRARIQGGAPALPVSTGQLQLTVRGPNTAAVGQAVVFEVQVTNTGKQAVTEMLLSAKLGDGLSHPAGNHIEADVGDLAPGASKSLKMATTAARPGRQSVDVKMTTTSGAEAMAATSVLINSGGLSIQVPPTTRLLLGREGEVSIGITNQHSENLRNVVVVETLPEGLQFSAASDRGIYQANSRTVQWLIDSLSAGETKTLSLKVKGAALGQFAKEVSARAESAPEVRAQGVVQVDSFSNLVLQVTPRDDPLEVGKETIIEVRVQNLGAAAATGVKLQVDLPPGLQSAYVQGPTTQRAQGRTLYFEPIAKLPSQTQAVYHVGVGALTPGDWRLRVQVVSDLNRAPVFRETALRVYRD